MKLSCIVIDDEYPARELIEAYIKKIPFLELQGSFKNPLEAIPELQSNTIDLLYLDIQMPELKGTNFLKQVDTDAEVIFTTAYPDYALEGYKLNVIDYLLKPISFDEFLRASTKALEHIQLKSKISHSEQEDVLHVKADGKVHFIRYDDIRYIEGLREYVRIHTHEVKLISLFALKDLQEELEPHGFIRTHKSYLVNSKKIISVNGNMVDLEDLSLPIGKSYRDAVLKKMGV